MKYEDDDIEFYIATLLFFTLFIKLSFKIAEWIYRITNGY